ncbi:MAG: class I tRNA ligase family protein [Gemmatimonadota bacterium]
MARTYITTAIDYSNGEPHVGHAFEKIGADVIARYRRLRGDDVRFVIGMDEHGQNVAQEAAQRGMEPQALVDELAELFASAWRRLEISNDDFIRTTEPRHAAAVTALLERIRAAGDLYLDRYAGYYCERCEAFRKESELVEGRCPWHPTRDIVWTEEENWFFRLSRFRDPLLDHIARNPDFIRPDSRRNEILRLLEGGLEDISASRARIPWGIPFPGAEDHTVYVWLDAVTNYLSAVGFPAEEYGEWWPANLHVIGKDITRFHCVIWPAMLMSAGVELPRAVWGHGFVMIGGGKLSKSEALLLELGALVDRHGPDAFRYFLLREAPWDSDRDFPSVQAFLDRFDERYNADLANDLGNLLNRSLTMIRKYRGGEVPEGEPTSLDEETERALGAYHERMEALLLNRALEAAMSVVREANGFIDASQPWKLAKEPESAARLDGVLGSVARALAAAAAMFAPFMPSKSRELWARLGGEGSVPSFTELATRRVRRLPADAGPVLFPRVEARAG